MQNGSRFRTDQDWGGTVPSFAVERSFQIPKALHQRDPVRSRKTGLVSNACTRTSLSSPSLAKSQYKREVREYGVAQ